MMKTKKSVIDTTLLSRTETEISEGMTMYVTKIPVMLTYHVLG
jgi:hypothetical protein